jgi:hypothetical protein
MRERGDPALGKGVMAGLARVKLGHDEDLGAVSSINAQPDEQFIARS